MSEHTSPGEWLDAHAIDREFARQLVREGTLGYGDGKWFFRYETPGGNTFWRYRRNGKVLQPKGQALRLWWPLGRAQGGWALLCEGESDALAASSLLAHSTHRALNALCPVGLPGQGMNKDTVAEELADAGIARVVVCFDADEAGRKGTRKVAEALAARGITPYHAALPEGYDLSDYLARWGAPAREHLLADAVALATLLGPIATKEAA